MTGYFSVGLSNPKTPANIGGVLRACGCYGAAMLAISGSRFKRHSTDTENAFKKLPMLLVDDLYSVIPFDCVPVAVELTDGAESLVSFKHPQRAYYIFGPEDGSLGQNVLRWCPHKVVIPTRSCMNLAACVNVVLYDRMAKLNQYSKSAS